MHGIGGATIAEAKRRMSMAEVGIWAAYREKYGSLDIGHRLERAQAMATTILANANGGEGYSPFDFMHEDEPEISLEHAMQNWG